MALDNAIRKEKRLLSFDETLETEFTKDRWNADHIVGARRGARGINGFRWIDFRDVPEQFRSLMKQWCQVLLTRFVTEYCGRKVQRVTVFLK